MAQLKNSIIQGSLRATDTIYGTNGQFETIKAQQKDGITYTTGDVGQVLTSDGITTHWSTINTSQIQSAEYLNGTNDISVTPLIDMTRANRLMFLPANQIIIEKTTDGGQTWISANVSDTNKRTLFWEQPTMIALPLISNKQNTLCGLRITITAMKYNVPANTEETAKYNYWNSSYVTAVERYCTLYSTYFWVTTNSNVNGISVKIERAKGNASTTWQVAAAPDPTKFVLTGWSGANIVTFPEDTFGGGTTQTDRYWNYRFTFMTVAQPGNTFDANRAAAQAVGIINSYGNSCWTSSNNFMRNDHIYRWDANQNTIFPAGVTATNFSGSGASLTNLNASNITSGTISVSRLPIQDIRSALGL